MKAVRKRGNGGAAKPRRGRNLLRCEFRYLKVEELLRVTGLVYCAAC